MRTHEPHYTIEEAARLTGRSESTIRRYIKAGRLPGAYLEGPESNGTYWIPRSNLPAAGLELRDEQAVPPAPESLPGDGRGTADVAVGGPAAAAAMARVEELERHLSSRAAEILRLERLLDRLIEGGPGAAR